MSRRWHIAGFVIAAIAFVATLAGPMPGRDDFLAGLPPVLQAVIYAISERRVDPIASARCRRWA